MGWFLYQHVAFFYCNFDFLVIPAGAIQGPLPPERTTSCLFLLLLLLLFDLGTVEGFSRALRECCSPARLLSTSQGSEAAKREDFCSFARGLRFEGEAEPPRPCS